MDHGKAVSAERQEELEIAELVKRVRRLGRKWTLLETQLDDKRAAHEKAMDAMEKELTEVRRLRDEAFRLLWQGIENDPR